VTKLAKEYEAAVIGGGPAGITAAVQLARSDWKVVLFEPEQLGGLLLNANLVENYPSGIGPVPGRELAGMFRSHLERFNVDTKQEKIDDISISDDLRIDLKAHSQTHSVRAVIIATGTIPKPILLPGLENVKSNQICYDIKDLKPLPENKKFVVVGGGDAAFDYALQLARNKNKGTILVRNKEPNCLKLLERRVSEKSALIEVKLDADVEKIENEAGSEKVNIYYKSESGGGKLKSDNLLVAIGRTPNDLLIKRLSEKLTNSIRTELNGKTNIPGLYLAGDIIGGSYRQVGIAVGSGLRTAMMVDKFLAGDELK
jgi:thioredoxin reductase (NADPH)